MQTATMTMQDIVRAAHARHKPDASVEDCLAYPGTTEVPAAFNRMARIDFAVLSEADDAAEWEDYCPAYALGLLTYDAYYRVATRVTEMELAALWNELRGSSQLSWLQAQAIVVRAWSALARLERDGQL
jgi:hypothetical protein